MIDRLRDLLGDVLIELTTRRSRVVLMLVAVALATGSLVMSWGISTTAARQINADLAASGTDVFTVMANSSASQSDNADAAGTGGTGTAPVARSASDATSRPAEQYFPQDAQHIAEKVSMVRAAGLMVQVAPSSIARLAEDSREATAGDDAPAVLGATSGYLAAVGARPSTAWMLDARAMHVVILGVDAAKELGIPTSLADYTGYRVSIAATAYDVVGVLPHISTGGLDHALVVPFQVAIDDLGGQATDTQMLVRTVPGGGAPVSHVICEALRPDAPERLKVSTVVDLESLRVGVNSQLSRFAGAIGILLLVLTALLIANSMITSVVSRTAEIGLRRALGASRGAVAVIFLADGGLTGLLGGIAGGAVGTAAVVAVAWLNGWTAYTSWEYLAAGPGIGMAAGIVASLYPALRAGGISPAEAVRAAE